MISVMKIKLFFFVIFLGMLPVTSAVISSNELFECITEKVLTACPGGTLYHHCTYNDNGLGCQFYSQPFDENKIVSELEEFENEKIVGFMVASFPVLFCREQNGSPHFLEFSNMNYFWEGRSLFCPSENVAINAADGSQVQYKSPYSIQASDTATVISNIDSNLNNISQKVDKIENQVNNSHNFSVIFGSLIGTFLSISLIEVIVKFVLPKFKKN